MTTRLIALVFPLSLQSAEKSYCAITVPQKNPLETAQKSLSEAHKNGNILSTLQRAANKILEAQGRAYVPQARQSKFVLMPGGHTTQIACCLIACLAIASWLIACEEVWLIAVSAIEAIGSMRCETKHLNHKNIRTYVPYGAQLCTQQCKKLW